MDSLEAMEIGRQTLIVFMKVSLPILMIALIVGLIISLFQALTQIQEMTLSFVPKITIVFLALMFLMPFMAHTLTDFTSELHTRIISVGASKE